MAFPGASVRRRRRWGGVRITDSDSQVCIYISSDICKSTENCGKIIIVHEISPIIRKYRHGGSGCSTFMHARRPYTTSGDTLGCFSSDGDRDIGGARGGRGGEVVGGSTFGEG